MKTDDDTSPLGNEQGQSLFDDDKIKSPESTERGLNNNVLINEQKNSQ